MLRFWSIATRRSTSVGEMTASSRASSGMSNSWTIAKRTGRGGRRRGGGSRINAGGGGRVSHLADHALFVADRELAPGREERKHPDNRAPSIHHEAPIPLGVMMLMRAVDVAGAGVSPGSEVTT